jgi:hypothetical protein
VPGRDHAALHASELGFIPRECSRSDVGGAALEQMRRSVLLVSSRYLSALDDIHERMDTEGLVSEINFSPRPGYRIPFLKVAERSAQSHGSC